VGLIVVISAILVLPLALPGRVELAAGQPARTDIFAPQYVRYESEVLTEQDRANARLATGPVYESNISLVDSQRRRLNDVLSTIESIRGNTDDLPAAREAQMHQLPNVDLTDADIRTLLQATPSGASRIRSEILRVYDNVMISGKIADTSQLQRQRDDLFTLFSSELSPQERRAAADVLAPFIAVNLILNPEKTEEARQKAAAAVQPRVVEVQKGEIILRVGQIADNAAIEKLEKAGLSNPTVTAANAAAVVGSVMIMLLLLHFYLLRLQPAIWRHRKSLLLLALVLVAPTVIMRVIVPGHAIWPYVLPLAAASMLVAVLLDANLALVITVVLAVFSALLTQGSFDLPFFYLVGGATAVFAIWRAERVSTFVVSGLYIAIASLAATLLLRVIENQHLDWNALWVLAAAGINGALSASLTFATFSLLGSWFGIATMLQLLELAHPTQPLLRRLMREAPGTYHHSLVVSNLAEHAAEVVGADPLLARVAGYYHDIGKVLNPYVFIENQSGMGNIHDTLDPVTSARLIRAHITDGQALAQRYSLPRRVADCIPQHHGTTMIKYFYHKALQDDPSTLADDFRNPGPKPQTKEAAVLMLADSVEATVRSIAQSGKLEHVGPLAPDEEPPANSILGIIRRTVKERLEDGQLDECDLTIRDLARIQEAFNTMLNGIYHPRIVYPEKPKADAPAPAPAAAAATMAGFIRRPFGMHVRLPGMRTKPPANGYLNSMDSTPPVTINALTGEASPVAQTVDKGASDVRSSEPS
jgi:putative nucleotidyltransferase with HDIG domain